MKPHVWTGAIGSIVLSATAAWAQKISLGIMEDTPRPEHYSLRLEYRRFRSILGEESQVQKGSGGRPGTLLDLKRDLGLADKDTSQVRGTLRLSARQKLRVSYTRLDYLGDVASSTRAFTYGATTFDRNARVLTSVKGGYYAADFELDLARGPWGFVGALLGAKVFDVDTVVVDPGAGKRETDTLRTPIPVLGVVGRGYAGRMSFEGELSGIDVGQRGSLWDADVSGRVHLSDRSAVAVGYRRLSLSAVDDPDLLALKLSGIHFGIELSF